MDKYKSPTMSITITILLTDFSWYLLWNLFWNFHRNVSAVLLGNWVALFLGNFHRFLEWNFLAAMVRHFFAFLVWNLNRNLMAVMLGNTMTLRNRDLNWN